MTTCNTLKPLQSDYFMLPQNRRNLQSNVYWIITIIIIMLQWQVMCSHASLLTVTGISKEIYSLFCGFFSRYVDIFLSFSWIFMSFIKTSLLFPVLFYISLQFPVLFYLLIFSVRFEYNTICRLYSTKVHQRKKYSQIKGNILLHSVKYCPL